jgi:hypothetical protein
VRGELLSSNAIYEGGAHVLGYLDIFSRLESCTGIPILMEELVSRLCSLAPEHTG